LLDLLVGLQPQHKTSTSRGEGVELFYRLAARAQFLIESDNPGYLVNAKLNCHFFADADVPRLTNSFFLAPDTIAGCAGEAAQCLRWTIELNRGRARRYSPEPAD
jgi:hypothetical protein